MLPVAGFASAAVVVAGFASAAVAADSASSAVAAVADCASAALAEVRDCASPAVAGAGASASASAAVAGAGDLASAAVAGAGDLASASSAVAEDAAGGAPVAAAMLASAGAAALTAGRGVRSVSLAITMPTAAQSAARAINWVPMSRRFSGLTEAAGAAAPAAYGAWAVLGLGVLAGMEGSNEPISPPALGDVTGPTGPIGTSGSELPERFSVPDPVLVVGGVGVALLGGVALDGTSTVIVAYAPSAILGLVLVTFALSVTCSPLVAEFGTATAACSSDVPVLSDEILHVLVWPVGHTVKCGVAEVGLVTRVTVTPSTLAPEADSQIAKYAVPPGWTLLLPEKTSTLSQSFTVVEPVAMYAAC